MKNYLIGMNLSGYASRVIANPNMPSQATEHHLNALNQWDEKDKLVIFIFSQNIPIAMIGHVQDLESSKEVWESLKKLHSTTTKARQIEGKNELNNLRKSASMSVHDYVLKNKDEVNSPASTCSPIADDDLVSFTLNGSREDDKWKSFTTSVYVRDSLPNFDQMIALMITLKLQGSSSKSNQSQAFYVGTRGRGEGRGRGRGRGKKYF